MNNIKEINIKNSKCYHFHGIIKVDNLDLGNILIDESSYEDILAYSI